MGSPDLAEQVLEMVRSLDLTVGVVRVRTDDGHDLWRIDATHAKGERWVAMDAEYYGAVVLLATFMGCDLEP